LDQFSTSSAAVKMISTAIPSTKAQLTRAPAHHQKIS
jgi:hypothetical protein